MIDFHNHVLPGIDDGSKSFEMSISMLKEAYSQGINEVVNTVHFQHPKMDGINISLEKMKNLVFDIENELSGIGIDIKIHLSAEVFYLPNLIDIKHEDYTTIGNGKYMLIEFQTHQLPKGFDQHLYDLYMSGTIPIIAHPERYKPIQDDISILVKLVNSGALVQIDAGSLLGHFGVKCNKTALKIVSSKMCHIIGSDAHNNDKRNFCLGDALKVCNSLVGRKESLNYVLNNPKKIINGEKINTLEIDFSYNTEKSFINRFLPFFKGKYFA